MKRPEKIGIFGGTFDPVHNGHLKAAAEVGRRFGLDSILFVPANIPPHKARPDISSARDRLAMVRLALRGRKRLVASPLEVRAGGTSYSIGTLRRVKKIHPRARIFFIVGTDAFLEIETWREWRGVLDACVVIVMTRPGVSLARARRAPGPEYASRVRAVGPTDRIRDDEYARTGIFLLPIDAAEISATEIRGRVREGQSIAGLVPPAVAAYVRRHSLYSQNTG
jgi:nicotinate-nucleotide adenylyltransferase